jgi:hypothetical protein
MPGNGKRRPPRPRIQITATNASPDEAAAIAAALEQFLADTAPAPVSKSAVGGWLRVALAEGVDHSPAAGRWG